MPSEASTGDTPPDQATKATTTHKASNAIREMGMRVLMTAAGSARRSCRGEGVVGDTSGPAGGASRGRGG